MDNFWNAYDNLKLAKTQHDSIDVFQKLYINTASNEFKEFLIARKFTAEEYVDSIKSHPKFWISIRPLTEKIKLRQIEIDTVFEKLKKFYPKFKAPNVCFAIGCIRTGGTTNENLILIGTEIAAADSTVDKSEIKSGFKNIIGNTGDIMAMIAHEAVHTQQIMPYKVSLLTQTIVEGAADFIPKIALGLNINAKTHNYGLLNECSLWKEFQQNIIDNNLSKWLYNSRTSIDRPANLGYFIGSQICENYYNNQPDKQKALKEILNGYNTKKILRLSKYGSKCGG